MTKKERLRVLYNYLKSGAVDEEAFDMNTWSHCAIGEGTRIPSLAKEGLRLKQIGDKPNPSYCAFTGMEAVARFFNLSFPQATRVFGYSIERRTVKDVTKAVRKLL